MIDGLTEREARALLREEDVCDAHMVDVFRALTDAPWAQKCLCPHKVVQIYLYARPGQWHRRIVKCCALHAWRIVPFPEGLTLIDIDQVKALRTCEAVLDV